MEKKLVILTVVALLTVHFLNAQDIERLKDQKPFTIHGSIGGGANFFTSNEKYETRDPFSWSLHGNLTPSIYGFSLPLNFVVTQYSKSYTTPFSQFGIAPTYKWIKLHLGYSQIRFSPMVFDGQRFLGAGIELSPGIFYLGAFYGRLNKAISEDTTFDRHIEPQYARKGYGFKVGIKEEKKEFSLMYFRARDDTGSIRKYNDSTSTVHAQANNIVGTKWAFTFFNRLKFAGTAAVSLWSRNLAYGEIDSIGTFKVPGFVQNVAPLNYSSVLSWSGQTQLSLMLNHFNVLVGYRRVQPDYKSLGVPYALNDIEMINSTLGANMMKGKINLNASFVTQHNNLEDMLSSELVSTTGNFNANILFSQHFNLNMNLTGVNVFQKDGLLKLTDSTRMNQLMLSFVLTPSLNFTGNGKQHTISGSFNYTKLNDKNPATAQQAGGKNMSASANYGLYFVQKYFGLNSGINYNTYGQKENSYQSLGLNVGANAQLLESRRLSLQGSIGYFLNKSSDSPTGNNITFSFNSNYATSKHHSFGLFMSYVLTPPVRLDPRDELDKFKYRVPYAVNSKILSGGVTYSYNF